jgi:hypothetical protein
MHDYSKQFNHLA